MITLLGIAIALLILQNQKIKEYRPSTVNHTVVKKVVDGNLVATIKTLECEKEDLKSTNDSLLLEIQEIAKKYKGMQTATSFKIKYRDSIVVKEVEVDRKDSCNPIYHAVINKPLAYYDITASKDSIQIKDSITIPVSVVQYHLKGNFFDRKELQTDVIVKNPSTDLDQITSYKVKESDHRLKYVVIGITAFLVGFLAH